MDNTIRLIQLVNLNNQIKISTFLLSLLIPLFITVFFLLKCKNITRSLSYISIIILFIIYNYIFWTDKIILKILLTIFNLILVILYYFISKNFSYDYILGDTIYSITYLLNSFKRPDPNKTCRIVGKVLPYKNSQMKFNGNYLTGNEITCAGGSFVTGGMGSGKTSFIKSLMEQNLDSGYSVIFTDYKGDKEDINSIIEMAHEAEKIGYEAFYIYNEKCNFCYDPLLNLNNSGRIEAIVNMRKWSIDGADDHYKTGLKVFLQSVISEFSHKFNEEKMTNFTYNFYKYLGNYRYLSKDKDSYDTAMNLLKLLINSGLKNMFNFDIDNCNKNNIKILDFNKLRDKKFIVIASFISSNSDLATSFSSLLFRDILDQFTSKVPNKDIFLYCDEMASVENPFIIKDIVQKSRSAKLASTFSIIDVNYFIDKTSEAFVKGLISSLNNFYIFNGCTRETAELFAGLQLSDINDIIVNLRKPNSQKKKGPTGIYISKYPRLDKKTNIEVFRFSPFIYKFQNKLFNNNDNNHDNLNNNINYYQQKNNLINKDININKNNIINNNINYNIDTDKNDLQNNFDKQEIKEEDNCIDFNEFI